MTGRLAKCLFAVLVLIAIACPRFSSAENRRSITFIAKVPYNTPVSDKVYLTGSSPELCSWQTKCVELKNIGNYVYSATVSFPEQVGYIEFKFTRGTWDTEVVDPRTRGPYANNNYVIRDPQGISIHQISMWKDLPLGVTGDLRIIPDVYSPQLGNKRAVRVWLPPAYEREPTRKYPVIYAHDGQNMFDPATSSAGVDWAVDETMTKLISEGVTHGAIVVGVDCTADRFAEYDYLQRGNLYARFLIDTVKPMIDKTFRTLSDREHTYTMGSSMGALISVALVWKHSDVFSRAGAVSLPAWIHDSAVFKIVDGSPAPALPAMIYFDYGDFGGDSAYPVPGQNLVDHLASLGFKEPQLEHRLFPYADHFEADWARRVEIPLRWMLSDR